MDLLLAYAVTFIPLCALALVLDVYFVQAAHPDSPALEISTSFGLAFLAYGAIVLALGHVELLRQWSFVVLAVAGAMVIVALRRRVAPWTGAARHAVVGTVRSSPLLSAGLVIVFGAVIALQVHAPILGDEKDYKWRTPLVYATRHHFVNVPFRLSNGIYLMELMSVPAATFREIPAARALEMVALLVAIGSVWATTRHLRGDAGWGVIALATSPVVAFATVHADSDLWAAALAFCAAAWIISRPLTMRRAAIIGLLLAAAAAVKIFMLAVGLLLVLLALVKLWRARSDIATIIRYAAVVGAIVAALIVVDGAHTWAVTGSVWKPNTTPLYHDGAPQLKSGQAAGRIPDIKDIAELPFVPYLTGVVGDEPYGTRTGLLMFLGLPVATIAAIAARKEWRKRLLLPLGIGAVAFLALGPVFIKTRFLLFSWIAWSVALGVTVTWVEKFRERDERNLLLVGLTAFGAFELVNTASELIKQLR